MNVFENNGFYVSARPFEIFISIFWKTRGREKSLESDFKI